MKPDSEAFKRLIQDALAKNQLTVFDIINHETDLLWNTEEGDIDEMVKRFKHTFQGV
jgi:hypothetical protein